MLLLFRRKAHSVRIRIPFHRISLLYRHRAVLMIVLSLVIVWSSILREWLALRYGRSIWWTLHLPHHLRTLEGYGKGRV